MKTKIFNIQKKVIIAIICLFCVFFLFGCGSVHYSVTVSSNGAVTLQLDLKFNATKLLQNLTAVGKTIPDDFVPDVQNYASAVYHNSYIDFEDMLDDVAVDGIVKTYSGDMTTSDVIDYVNKNIEFSNGSGSWVQKNNEISCKIFLKFKTYNAYRYFNGIYPSTEDVDDPEVEEYRKDYFFFAEDYTVTKSVFNDIQNKSYTTYFLNYFNNFVDDLVSVDDMKYSFSYSTPSTKIYSDADEIYKDTETGNIIHKWNFSTDELKAGNSKISTYQVKIRAWVWYVMAFVISILVGVVLYVIVKVKETKHKKLLITNTQNFDKTSEEIQQVYNQEKLDK